MEPVEQGQQVLVINQDPQVDRDAEGQDGSGGFRPLAENLDAITATIVKEDRNDQEEQVIGVPPAIKKEGKDRQPGFGGVHLEITQQEIDQQRHRHKENEESNGVKKHAGSLKERGSG